MSTNTEPNVSDNGVGEKTHRRFFEFVEPESQSLFRRCGSIEPSDATQAAVQGGDFILVTYCIGPPPAGPAPW